LHKEEFIDLREAHIIAVVHFVINLQNQYWDDNNFNNGAKSVEETTLLEKGTFGSTQNDENIEIEEYTNDIITCTLFNENFKFTEKYTGTSNRWNIEELTMYKISTNEEKDREDIIITNTEIIASCFENISESNSILGGSGFCLDHFEYNDFPSEVTNAQNIAGHNNVARIVENIYMIFL